MYLTSILSVSTEIILENARFYNVNTIILYSEKKFHSSANFRGIINSHYIFVILRVTNPSFNKIIRNE